MIFGRPQRATGARVLKWPWVVTSSGTADPSRQTAARGKSRFRAVGGLNRNALIDYSSATITKRDGKATSTEVPTGRQTTDHIKISRPGPVRRPSHGHGGRPAGPVANNHYAPPPWTPSQPDLDGDRATVTESRLPGPVVSGNHDGNSGYRANLNLNARPLLLRGPGHKGHWHDSPN